MIPPCVVKTSFSRNNDPGLTVVRSISKILQSIKKVVSEILSFPSIIQKKREAHAKYLRAKGLCSQTTPKCPQATGRNYHKVMTDLFGDEED